MMSVFVVTYVTTEDVGNSGALKAFHDRQDALTFAQEAAQETLDNLKVEGVTIDSNEDGSFFESGDDCYWFTVDEVDLHTRG